MMKKHEEEVPSPSFLAHASTILKVGDVMWMACMAGSMEGAPDTHIDLSCKKGGRAWELFNQIKISISPHWNPVLTHQKDGTYIFFYTGHFPTSWNMHHIRIGDKTPSTYPAGVVGPVRKWQQFKNEDGKYEQYTSYETQSRWSIARILSRDWKMNWNVSTHHTGLEGIQPVFVKDTLYFRTKMSGLEVLSYSEGASRIDHPNSGFDVLEHQGKIYLAVNRTTDGTRGNLTVVCKDTEEELLIQTMHNSGTGEVSYPQMISDGDDILLSYTQGRQQINIVRISP